MKKFTKEQAFRLSQQSDPPDLVPVMTERKRRHRKQKGEVTRRADGTWWLRYYVDDVAGSNRVKVSEQIAEAGATMNEVDAASNRRMAEINKVGPAQIVREDDVSLGQFFEFTYLPWLKKEKEFATWDGARRRWKYMKPIEKKSLKRFQTIDATEFLTKLAEKPLRNGHGKPLKDEYGKQRIGLNQNTLNACRNLLSAMFRHAQNVRGTGCEGRENPIHACKTMTRPQPIIERKPYTDDEIIRMIDAIPSADGKLFFGLCCWMGMRPSEAAALKWSDFGETHVHVERSAAYGHLRLTTKNKKIRDVLVSDEVREYLTKLRAEPKHANDEADDFIFTRPGGLPINHNNFVIAKIREFARKALCPEHEEKQLDCPKCSRYCGPYNGRHSTLSGLKRATGNSLAASDVAGHKGVQTVEKTYIHTVTADGDFGMRLRQAEIAKARELLKAQG